ncbi:MAG: enoyl-CoA hydratase-related protein [Rhodobacterales bacterium]|nr:enoyl-CoA hydratase-related protein [Rhodobacterales bacterium]
MKHYETITLDISNDIAVLQLNRPAKMNAINTVMRAEIADAAGVAGRTARVLVMTGNGRAFCAGQDLSDTGNLEAMDLERVLRDEYMPMLRAIGDSPIPTVAAVNGPAAGAGANLALCADVVIAAHSAYFMQAFTRIGLMPDAGGTYWLPRQIGAAKAMGAALFAEPISAVDAAEWGMIWEAVPNAEFEARWQSRAAHLAAGPTESYRHLKAAIRGSWDNSHDSQLDLEARLQGACGQTRDFKEGVVAFLDKREAKFEGR